MLQVGITLIILLLILIVFLLFYPFKVVIWNELEYLYVKISNLVTIKINMLILFDNNHNDEIKKQVSMIKLLNKIRIKSIDLKMSGLNLDYEYGGEIFGYLNIILAVLKNYLMMKNSEFTYNIRYLGKRSIKFKSIFYVKMGIILKQVLGGKKSETKSH